MVVRPRFTDGEDMSAPYLSCVYVMLTAHPTDMGWFRRLLCALRTASTLGRDGVQG